jgi:hypothetical protein
MSGRAAPAHIDSGHYYPLHLIYSVSSKIFALPDRKGMRGRKCADDFRLVRRLSLLLDARAQSYKPLVKIRFKFLSGITFRIPFRVYIPP